jgi:hypothetical protein
MPRVNGWIKVKDDKIRFQDWVGDGDPVMGWNHEDTHQLLLINKTTVYNPHETVYRVWAATDEEQNLLNTVSTKEKAREEAVYHMKYGDGKHGRLV